MRQINPQVFLTRGRHGLQTVLAVFTLMLATNCTTNRPSHTYVAGSIDEAIDRDLGVRSTPTQWWEVFLIPFGGFDGPYGPFPGDRE